MLKTTELLRDLGQSLWLDIMTRDMLDDGTLERYRDELSITGLISNPTSFEEALRRVNAYDDEIRTLAEKGIRGEQLFSELAISDLLRAADLFRPIFDETHGREGWDSIEVSPLVVHDPVATTRAAQRIHRAASRPNLFVKIPGTDVAVGVDTTTLAKKLQLEEGDSSIRSWHSLLESLNRKRQGFAKASAQV